MRNLAKETEDRPIKPLPPVEKPTPNQSLGWQRGILARHMINAGTFDNKARMRLMNMDMDRVNKEIERYTSKAA